MRGRLLSLLRAARSASNNSTTGNTATRNLAPLSPRRLAGFAHDIARGMEYISEKKVSFIKQRNLELNVSTSFFIDCPS